MGRHEVGHIDNSMRIPVNNGAGCRFEGHFSINKDILCGPLPGSGECRSNQTQLSTSMEPTFSSEETEESKMKIRWQVPGNFHVSTHSATAQPQNPDMTHVIHKLSFGDTLQDEESHLQRVQPSSFLCGSSEGKLNTDHLISTSCRQVQNVHGAFNALGGADRLTSNPLASHDYILKIVPTVYEDKSGKQRYSYQYTVANKEYVAYSHTGRIIPAIWFRYDLSPITVKYTERRQPLYRFITTICAIIGGTFTVAGILDSCIFTASEAWKKIQLGKMH
ncbi:endoplasmic reticulum-Golgi intermediate compartment protein 1 isoform X4 [Canis lupus dingo]|nr:endoplasmic reticulum-Golgi intermediate compartment protein 1 isoform X4 [Canis lupus dingo]XP_048965089.1 endoplasmic reticulum-Golgi intermediate compartment protein 1 isoform X4 [Canis lupus dingo]XP_048965090.1 endoplasmic reticulum-Golgi intermediate compartment protein 1 isoform X4 [Canis lupus dingo]